MLSTAGSKRRPGGMKRVGRRSYSSTRNGYVGGTLVRRPLITFRGGSCCHLPELSRMFRLVQLPPCNIL